ncbi:hypothetical protein AC1031_010786 [Aphanomyces cochlioides]|nr:hypothetical protein AC1031_010786 [Aphanomyces cochlioides]
MVPLNIEDEVKYWYARNVTLWRVLFGNWDQIDLTNSITIISALGTEFTMTVSTVPQKNRASTVTKNTMFTSMYVDMFFAQYTNTSLIATDPSFLWKDTSLLQGWDAGTSIVFNAFGPLYTIDLYLMSPPNFLVELVQMFSTLTLEKQWGGESTADLLDDILPFEIRKPKEQAWNEVQSILAFISGSPLCPSFDQTTDYLLQEWGFDDVCGSQKPLTVPVSRQSLLFAMFASISKSSSSYQLNSVVCDWADDASMCQKSIGAAIQFVSQYELNHTVYSLLDEASSATSSIEIVQLALNRSSGTSLLLRHAIADPSDQAFAFVGWSYLYDWIVGDREVASFQGDVSTYDLISYKYTSNVPIKPLLSEFPNSVARFVELGVIYVSIAMTCVALTICLLSLLH